MNTKLMAMLIIFVSLLSVSFAYDFNPRANMTGKGLYSIYNFTLVNATTGDFDTLDIVNVTISDVQVSTINATSIVATDLTVTNTISGSIDGNAATATSWDGETSQADLNVNSSNSTTFWAGVSSFQSRWFSDVGNVLTFAESLLNSTIQALSLDQTEGDARYILQSNEGNLNVNSSVYWDDETSQANLNVNSSNYWDSLNTPADITGLGDSNIDSLSWTKLQNYPVACPANTYVVQIDDTITCQTVSSIPNNVDITGDLNVTGTAYINGLEVTTDGVIQGNQVINGNLTILGDVIDANVTTMNLNGSFLPQLTSVFNIGSDSLKWLNGYFSGTLDAATLNTGQGDNELYAMNQDVESTDAVTFAQGTITGDLTVDTNTLYVDSVDNNVGIGTLDPSTPLEVKGPDGTGPTIQTTNVAGNEVNSLWSDSSGDGYFRQKISAGTVNTVIQADGNSYINGGNVGFGTTNPLNKLSVVGSSSDGISSSGNALRVGTSTNGLIFGANDSGNYGFVQAVNADDFAIQPNGGNVGIGTTSPTADLDIGGSTPAQLLPSSTTLGVSGNLAGTVYIEGSSQASVFLEDGSSTAGYEGVQMVSLQDLLKFRAIDGSTYGITTDNILVLEKDTGNVGVGIATPETELHVEGELTIGRTLNSQNTLISHEGGANIITSDNPTSGILPSTIFKSQNSTDTVEIMRLQGDGNVGIGTDNPVTPLQVIGSNANAVLTSQDSTGAHYTAIGTVSNVSYVTAGSIGSNSMDMVFRTASTGTETERMRIDSTGEVDIGSISGDGTGKAVCIKSDGNLGTCTNAVGASGTCTCA